MSRYSSWLQLWKPIHSPKRSDSESFSSTGLARVDGGRALVVHHLPRHEMAAVGGCIEEHVGRPSLDAAFEHGLQRLVGGVRRLEGEVVAEEDEAVAGLAAQMVEEAGQRGDVLAMDLDELQPAADLSMHGLDERPLAHAPRAGGKPAGETHRVGEERVPHPVDAF
jgi:hypothetical protein